MLQSKREFAVILNAKYLKLREAARIIQVHPTLMQDPWKQRTVSSWTQKRAVEGATPEKDLLYDCCSQIQGLRFRDQKQACRDYVPYSASSWKENEDPSPKISKKWTLSTVWKSLEMDSPESPSNGKLANIMILSLWNPERETSWSDLLGVYRILRFQTLIKYVNNRKLTQARRKDMNRINYKDSRFSG